MPAPLLLLGYGQVGKAVRRQTVRHEKIYATTRRPERLLELAEAAVEPIIMPVAAAEIIEPLATNADVLVSMPPDGTTDQVLADACKRARCLVYISTTGVFGKASGIVDDQTPVDIHSESMKMRLEAEAIWHKIGASVLRPPGIYGPDSGLHIRLANGSYRLPADGSNVLSRIHVDDLAAFILRIFEQNIHGETFVVGDLEPANHAVLVSWLCERMHLPMPDSLPLDAVPLTLRGNRTVDSSRARKVLSITLKYPTYREGYQQCLAHMPAEVTPEMTD